MRDGPAGWVRARLLWAGSLLALGAAWSAGACGGGDDGTDSSTGGAAAAGASEAGHGTGGHGAGATGGGGAAGAATGGHGAATTGGGGSGGAMGGAGGSTCTHQGALGDPCEGDCDCAIGQACRGLPGEQICSVPCDTWDGCVDAEVGCVDRFCDFNVGACRCSCTEALCPDGECAGSYCVVCATDEHCASLSCAEPGLDQPRCRHDTESCVCGGSCMDGFCDEVEQALHSCPGDCSGPCVEGEMWPHSCSVGVLAPWCTCVGGAWQCIDPAPGCPGATACEQMGGMCVDTLASCPSGQVDPEPQGCGGGYPLCCHPTDCIGPGMTYPPGSGLCCPGLRALDSAMPTPGMDPEAPGVTCFANCWQYSCAPCGDGRCEPHLTENPCNCPEDCPQPPYPLVCSPSLPDGCGKPFCRQEGEVCHLEIPSCEADNSCTREVQDLPGQICDPIQAACVVP